MVAMLPVWMRKIILRASGRAETLREQTDWDINPCGSSTSYAHEMKKIGIRGIREAAQQIIRERR